MTPIVKEPYSRAEHFYDLDDDTRSPVTEGIDREVGLVAHLPVGKGTCEIIPVSLSLGWLGFEQALDVRAWRKSGFRLPDATLGRGAPSERRTWLVDEVRRLIREFPEAAEMLARQWLIGVPFLKQEGHTPEQLDQIARAV